MGESREKLIKWLMLAFNLLFWVSGVGLIIAGALAQTQYKPYLSFLNASYLGAPVLLIVVGAIITIIAFFGCCGAAKENYCMLMTFAVLLGVIFVVELAGGIAAYVEREKVGGYVEEHMNATLKNYTNDAAAKDMWDGVQVKSAIKDGCCGVYGWQDWAGTEFNETFDKKPVLVPRSCCKEALMPNTTDTCDRTYFMLTAHCEGMDQSRCPIYTAGCQPILAKNLRQSIGIIGGIGVGVSFIQLLGIVFACYLARRVRGGY